MSEPSLLASRLTPEGDGVVIVDQSKLPGEVTYLTLTGLEEMVEAIRALRVRGAPAIGVFAGYCMYVLARPLAARFPEREAFLNALEETGHVLAQARPTAVNLSWAVERMLRRARQGDRPEDILPALRGECEAIFQEDVEMCLAISRHGLSLLKPGDGVLTHCNAGPLATSRYGTGQGPLFLAKERGMHLKVFADETRPLLQGARLTAYELSRAGIDVTLICDNMAGMVMKNGWVQACMVGCDRVAANGDVANKIGTSSVAVLAHYYHIPFYVLGPTSTIDMACKTGSEIQIEQRDPDEIREMFYQEPMAPKGVNCYNPAFDVTDHSLITAIITEKGICYPPFTDSLAAQMQFGT